MEPPATQVWSPEALSQLHRWLAEAPGHALPAPSTAALDAAQQSGDVAGIDRAATQAALQLARAIALGCTASDARSGWHVPDADARLDLAAMLRDALAGQRVDAFFADLLPQHPDYAALHAAYATETDPARRATIARNMERWRWMPHALGKDFLQVNAAAFRVDLWRDGAKARSWKVIVGKVSSPTPVFMATVRGVQVNPWWDIPPNIVRESVGSLVRRHPDLARKRGYVWGGGRYRQRPGPGNSLGLMKLVMPNSFNIYLHDTPTKSLFARDVRAFSHGCVRVDDAMGLAEALLMPDVPRAQIDAAVASGATTDLRLAHSLPVYITYFTAEPGEDGKIAILPDIYNRDGAMGDVDRPRAPCPA